MVWPVKRIEFSYPRSDLKTLDSKIETLKGDWVVWWYNNIRRNPDPKSKTIPLVELYLKRLDAKDIPCASTLALVPLSNLPHYRIGTIWREGRCISDTELQEERFDVDFSSEGWSITSREVLYSEGMEHLFHDREYPLKYRRDKTQLIVFNLANGKNLLVPCIDYFVRGYVKNMDVCRAIVSLLFRSVMEVFYETTLRDEHEWIVRPTHKARDYDSAFFGHLLYDDYTSEVVRHLNSQFLSRKPGDIVFPEVRPWFSDLAKLECRGKWINEGQTFLCLDLCGFSEPAGQPIQWVRKKFDSTNGKKGEGRLVMPVVARTAEADEFIAEESFVEPDGHAEITIVKAPPVSRLGDKREVKKIKDVIRTDQGRRGPLPPQPTSHSSGTGSGSGKKVGKSEHVADQPPDMEIESQGFLNDIWNAFQSIKSENPGRVTDVSWYTPPVFDSSTPPRIILFNADGLSSENSDVIKWIYLDADCTQRRGLMVLRITVDGHAYLCFEIQRAEPDEKNKKPRGFSGVLMKSHVSNPTEMEEFVNLICVSTRQLKGGFKHLRGLFPKTTKIFHHRPHGKSLFHRRRLINAFLDLEVELE